ncbi:MAG: symmetrical bis(5'-nucleosyl)-tetraphosphatase [Pseudomonadota bacterium]
MATYAVGDIQGCHDELSALLDRMRFDPAADRLWLVGDLVNRGPDSLSVVRLVRSLGDAVRCVLGNHDLHLLAIRYGGQSPKPGDTLAEVLESPDCDEICEWLRMLPLLIHDAGLGCVMTHAGVPHIWSLEEAAARAHEVETVLRGGNFRDFIANMYGDEPSVWGDDLAGIDRLRVITNYFTRMRLVDRNGRMDFAHKGKLSDAPIGWYPWYELRARHPLGADIVFGHWAALEGETGYRDMIALDTGCVWGRTLTGVCLETREFFSIPARHGFF